MDEKRSGRMAGSKVSQIANIFQSMSPGKEEAGVVSVVRTESHVARFNTARALFEKLGEETREVRPAPRIINGHDLLNGTKDAKETKVSRDKPNINGA